MLASAGVDMRIAFDPTARSAAEQMAYDAQAAEAATAVARFFLWRRPTVSFARSPSPPLWFDPDSWARGGLEWVHRPTGGGIAFHGSDVSFSLVIPHAMGLSLRESLASSGEYIGRLCRDYTDEITVDSDTQAAGRVDYCLTQPSPYAVFWRGRKLAGLAARRFPQAWLIQGSLLVRPLAAELWCALPVQVQRDLKEKAISLTEAAGRDMPAAEIGARAAEQWRASRQSSLETVKT